MNDHVTTRRLRFGLRTMFMAVIVIAVVSLLIRYAFKVDQIDWQPFSKAKVQQANSDGKTVLVTFTADWDPSMFHLEALTVTSDVQKTIRALGVITMRADCSGMGPDIQSELVALGENAIPLLVVYRPNAGPVILKADNGGPERLIKVLENSQGSP